MYAFGEFEQCYLLFARNRSSCRTQIAFKHNKAASRREYNPNAIFISQPIDDEGNVSGSKQMMQYTSTWVYVYK